MSVTSWVDGVLAQIENHEANVDAAIVRVRKSTARARVQLRRVERDQTKLKDNLAAEDEASSAWLRRVKATKDEDAALECLRRAKTAERRCARLRERLGEHERTHKELSDGIGQLNDRLSELVERRNLMRTRQSRAEAMHGMATATTPIGDLEDLFERWETRVTEVEIASDAADYVDTFEAEFESAEQTAALLEELREMRLEEQ
jgi:phage shock protein A